MDTKSYTAIYLRVSTEEQRERQTIQTQRDAAERYCAAQNIAIYGWYADDGVSGTVPLDQRPEGARLLADARAGAVKVVLVWRLDRLGRDPRLTLIAVNDLEQCGAQVRSITEAFDTATPAGRLMLTMLSGMAGFERDSIIQRSVEGTNRLAREGVWLGGIVPYGYRVEGKDRDARLVVSEQRIPGTDMSEADVIRLIYRRCGDLNEPCQAVADYLNALGVPPAYVRDGRELLRGKRTGRTQGIWRAGRIGNMIRNPVYKGIHRYGMRSKKHREIIEREVAAIVSVEQWGRAQEMLRSRMIFSSRNAKYKYLLRGLITCGCCGLNYCGTPYHVHKGEPPIAYYSCNGAHQFRGIYGARGERCPSKAINGAQLEAAIWRDVEGFLRDPDPVLAQLAERAHTQADESDSLRAEIARMQQLAQGKQQEKDTVIALYRRGRIEAADLDRQLDQIQHEEAGLRDAITALHERLAAAGRVGEGLHSAEAMLRELHARLGEYDGDAAAITWELKRELVEKLVKEVRVDTVRDEETGKKRSTVTVTYRFNDQAMTLAATGTGTRADSSYGESASGEEAGATVIRTYAA